MLFLKRIAARSWKAAGLLTLPLGVVMIACNGANPDLAPTSGLTCQDLGTARLSLSPSQIPAGSPGASVTVNDHSDKAFFPSSLALWNGSANGVGMTYVGNDTLIVTVAASVLTSPGTAQVTIQQQCNGDTLTSQPVPFTITATPSAVSITTASPLIGGTVGQAYDQAFAASDGSGMYLWALASLPSTLPAGLSLSRDGALTGTPTAAGNFNFIVQVLDSSGNAASRAFTVTISSANNPLPNITSLSPSSALVASGSFVLTINGTGFAAGATVVFGTGTLTPSLVTPNQIQVTIPASDLSPTGPVPVFVINPAPAGGTSNHATFNIVSQITYNSTGPILTPGDTPALDDVGDTAVVGNDAFATMFVRDNTGVWSQATRLNNPAGNVASVAISGDGKTVVIGDCSNNVCIGHAYVYVAPPGGWTSDAMNPTATLSGSNAQAKARIGFSVATDHTGDTIAVGAPCDFTAGITLCGTVYVYSEPSGGWTSNFEDAQLTITGTDTLGLSLSMDSAGQTIVAGLPGVQFLADTPGAVYVFTKPVGGWTSSSSADATLSASAGTGGDLLGWSTSISGDGKTVVAGAPYYPNCSPVPCTDLGPGAAFIFVKPSGGWSSKAEDALLSASDGQSGNKFGSSISISSTAFTIVVGAPNSPFTPPNTPGPGAAYVFLMPIAGWSGPQHENQILTAFSGSDTLGNSVTPSSNFGGFKAGVSISRGPGILDADIVAVGGLATVSGTVNQGVIYFFQ